MLLAVSISPISPIDSAFHNTVCDQIVYQPQAVFMEKGLVFFADDFLFICPIAIVIISRVMKHHAHIDFLFLVQETLL